MPVAPGSAGRRLARSPRRSSRMADDRDQYDALLWWASELGSGSWQQFKDACAHLGLAAVTALRTLGVLGHLEIAWGAGRWAAAPTTLTTIPTLPGRLLVCGA